MRGCVGKPKGLPVRRDWSVNPAQSFTMFDSVVKGLQPILYEVIMTTSNAIATSVPTVSIVNNHAITTSKAVAEFFGKRHADVLRAIENLDCSPEFTSTNFCVHAEFIQAGAVERESKYYEMTKDGFTFLVMGFTGKRAAQFKEAYINRFNELETALHNPLALTNGQHYVVAKDGVVIYHKVLSDRTAKKYISQMAIQEDQNNLAMLSHDTTNKVMDYFAALHDEIRRLGGKSPTYPQFDKETIVKAVVTSMVNSSRMLLSFSASTGQPCIKFVPNDCWVVTSDNIANIVGSSDGVPKRLLPDIAKAAVNRLSGN